MNCLNCGKKLKQTPGKRAKQFCDSTCRTTYWQKKKKEVKIQSPSIPIDTKLVKSKVVKSKWTVQEASPEEIEVFTDSSVELTAKIAELEQANVELTSKLRLMGDNNVKMEHQLGILRTENAELRQKTAKGPSLADVVMGHINKPTEDRAANIRDIKGGKGKKEGK